MLLSVTSAPFAYFSFRCVAISNFHLSLKLLILFWRLSAFQKLSADLQLAALRGRSDFSGIDLIDNILLILIFLFSFGLFLFLYRSLRFFLGTLFVVLTFGHDFLSYLAIIVVSLW